MGRGILLGFSAVASGHFKFTFPDLSVSDAFLLSLALQAIAKEMVTELALENAPEKCSQQDPSDALH